MTLREIELATNKFVLLRTCWKCNNLHEDLKEVGYIIWCFECGNMFMNGKKLRKKDLKEIEKEWKLKKKEN